MIYVRDFGRMCNNLLQYGHAYALAREHGLKSTSMRFSYKYRWFAISKDRRHNFLSYILAKYGSKAGLLPVISFDTPRDNDPELAVKEARMLSGKSVVVQGWELRHYELFLKYRDEITAMFAFQSKITDSVKEFMTKSEGNSLRPLRLGVHIRRGDYARWQGGRYLFDDSVYLRKMNEFAAMHPGRPLHIYICGNDPALSPATYSEANGHVHMMNGNPAQDLCLLSECDAIIGAPSTFSLVGAMYRDLPLAWIMDKDKPLTKDDFRKFDYLFRHII